ncbi:helix-turn-helix domain-containing protein [Clostridium perfringens]
MSGYTQDELSKLIELSKLYINNLEAKTETHLTKAKLIKLNYYLDLSYLLPIYGHSCYSFATHI